MLQVAPRLPKASPSRHRHTALARGLPAQVGGLALALALALAESSHYACLKPFQSQKMCVMTTLDEREGEVAP